MPQPVDFNTEVAKVTAAERAQEVMARVSLAAQQRQTTAEQENRVRAETEVRQTAETENLQVQADAKRRNPFIGRRRRRHTPSEDAGDAGAASPGAENTARTDPEQHQLDVTV